MDKKNKTNEKKVTENNISAKKKSNVVSKIENKKLIDKELKIATDEEDDMKITVKLSTKGVKKPSMDNTTSTPKSVTKSTINEKAKTQKKVIQEKKLQSKTSEKQASPQSHNVEKDSKIELKKLFGLSNPLCEQILTNFESKLNIVIRENIETCFNQVKALSSNEFFLKFTELKRNFIDLISSSQHISDYSTFLLKFLENSINQINKKIKSEKNDTDNLNDVSNFSDDMIIDFHYKNNNAVYFEIPFNERKYSFNDEGYSSCKEKLMKKFQQKIRQSSAEIEKRIRKKMENTEKNKELIKKQHQENAQKLMNKITDIKRKKKKEKEQKFQKILNKTENFEKRHKQFLEEKTQKAKNEQEKVIGVNFINRLEKENRSFSLLRKLDISIERRKNYMMQRLSKIQRGKKEEEVETRRKANEEEKLLKIMRKNLKISENKSNKNENKPITEQKLELANKRKIKFYEKYELLKSIYQENLIYDLLEEDYFEIEELYELSNLTKFEILKAKLKKDKEKIDKMFDKQQSGNKNESSKKKSSVGMGSIVSSENSYFEDEKPDEESLSDCDSIREKVNKLSKSFTFTNDQDKDEFNNLLNETVITKSSKKKKRKNKNNEKQPQGTKVIEKKLIKTLNSLSSKNLKTILRKVKKTNGLRKLLIRSTKSGRYIKSKILVTEENQDKNLINYNSFSGINSSNIKPSESNSSIIVPNSISSLIDNQKEKDEGKEKLIKTLIQNSGVLKQENNSTILINSESLVSILEKNSITLRWCKLCNIIFSNESESMLHIQSKEHKKMKAEYGLSLQDDSNLILLFQSFPGDISEDLRNERINAIKSRFKKVKQKLLLKQVKHENFWSYKQDFPSTNKQRVQKLSFDIEKIAFPNIKDYEQLESLLKEVIKILEQKKQNDLHIMRQLKIIHYLVEILKRPAVCHKTELKNLMKVIDLIIKIILSFSTLTENRNYLVVTNRLSVLLDFLLWVLNKPTKIPLGITFLPDLIYIITILIKHRIPFEYLAMKDDFLEYAFLSSILVKFRAKFTSLVGPIDLTGGFGSFSLVLLKSLGMIEALTNQININYCSKPVYVKSNKISENILFVLENTEIVGLVQLLTTLLLSNGPIKPKTENTPKTVLPQTVVTATLLAIKIMNNTARLDLKMFQNIFKNNYLQEQIYHVLNYIIVYSIENLESFDVVKELLHETLLMINYYTLLNEKDQNSLSKGEVTVVQKICNLPHIYFFEKRYKDILFPTIISMSFNNPRNTEIINKELNIEMIVMFLKEKIQLEPIIEEEELDKTGELNEEDFSNLITLDIGKDGIIPTRANPNENTLKKRTMSFGSSASSTKSCHDMIQGISDFVLFYHRFPRNLWEKALDFYSNFGK